MQQVADLRNKLTPFKNYLALQDKYNGIDDELDKLDELLDAEIEKGNVDKSKIITKYESEYDKFQIQQQDLKAFMGELLKQMQTNMPLIEDILKTM